MLSEQQAKTMLSLQAAMNTRVDPNWLHARYPYLRAVMMESAEAIEHHGWKWWKKQDKDLAQLQMELIDIWHFILSQLLLQENGNEASTFGKLQELLAETEHKLSVNFDDQVYIVDSIDLLDQLELLIALSARGRIELSVFAAIMNSCGMDWTELYCQYVGKNVLNFFRQDNGYKKGSYQKIWNGREDNEYLVDIMATLDPEDIQYKDKLYSTLSAHYPNQEKAG